MSQFLYSKIPFLTYLQGQAVIGAAGAVSSSTGVGMYALTKLGTGIYQIQFKENYYAFLGASFQAVGPKGSTVSAGSFVTGVLYSIVAVGNTSWTAIGLPAGLNGGAAIGQSFVATGAGSGTGTAAPILASGVDIVEIPTNPQVMLNNINSGVGQGAIIQFQTMGIQTAAFTGDTHTNTTVDNISSMAGIVVGQAISGTGIPLGATVATIAGASSITISAAATATAAGVAMTVAPARLLSSPVSGSTILFNLFFKNSSATY